MTTNPNTIIEKIDELKIEIEFCITWKGEDAKYEIAMFDAAMKKIDELVALVQSTERAKIRKLENKQLMLMRDDEALPVVLWKDIVEALK